MVVNNLRIIMILGFITAFSAGVMAGKLWERSVVKAEATGGNGVTGPLVPPPPLEAPQPSPPKGGPPEPSWTKDLKLTADQSEKMRSIWSELMKNGPMNHERRDALRKERDDAIKALLTDEQHKQQTTILAQFESKNDDISKQMRSAQDASRKQRDEALKAIFDPEQRKQYDVAVKTYESKTEELSKEWKRSFDDAVERTRQLLTPEQRVKYDDIRKKREEQPHRHFSPDWSRGPGNHADPRTDPRNDGRNPKP